MAGTRVYYLLILLGLVPVRPIKQRRGISATRTPKMEMRYMHLREGASGVSSRVGMAKTGRCGRGKGGGVDARVGAMLGRKLQAGSPDKP